MLLLNTSYKNLFFIYLFIHSFIHIPHDPQQFTRTIGYTIGQLTQKACKLHKSNMHTKRLNISAM
jgi:hypothetical protein